MERSLLIGAVVIGAAGWLAALLLTLRLRIELPAIRGVFFYLALALPVLVLVASLVRVLPFSSGVGLGFVLGAAGALLAALSSLRGDPRNPAAQALSLAGSLFMALAVVGGVVLWVPQPLEAAPAAAIGWCAVSLLLLESLRFYPETSARSVLFSSVGFVVALSAAVALGIYRTTQEVPPLAWESLAAGLAASVPIGLLVAGFVTLLTRSRTGSASTSRFTLSPVNVVPAALVAILTVVLSSRLPRGAVVLPTLAAVGLGMAGLIRWMVAEAGRSQNQTLHNTLAAFVVVGAFAAAFSLLAGYGVGLMLLAAWALLPQGIDEDSSGVTTGLATFAVLLVVYRLFAQRYQAALATASLTDHFALLGFVAGALLPQVMTGIARAMGSSESRRLAGLVLALIVGLGVPAAMIILWNVRVAPALLFGLAVASAGWGLGLRDRDEAISSGVLTLAVALAMTEWTGWILASADLTRAERMRILAWITAGTVFSVLIAEYAGRFLTRIGRRGQPQTLRGAP